MRSSSMGSFVSLALLVGSPTLPLFASLTTKLPSITISQLRHRNHQWSAPQIHQPWLYVNTINPHRRIFQGWIYLVTVVILRIRMVSAHSLISHSYFKLGRSSSKYSTWVTNATLSIDLTWQQHIKIVVSQWPILIKSTYINKQWIVNLRWTIGRRSRAKKPSIV